jgi:protein gp37
MMNKSKIEWTDFTWNPVTGCLHSCPYCYARKQARRFSGDVRLNKSSDQLKRDENGLYILEEPFKNQVTGKVIPDPVGFEPIMHRYRMPHPAQKKKPAKIFVCSMADLFGAWVPDSWIKEVFKACDAAPWHTYMFLTKNPRRYMELAEKGIIRTADNFWYGSTATTPETEFFWHDQLNTFVSIEPILEAFPDSANPDSGIQKVKWVIVGAETGVQRDKVVPEKEWIRDIVKACRATKTPVFLKDSLENIWGEDLIQEWPEGMPVDKSNDVPHCKECEQHKATQEGKRGDRHECELEGRRIKGRHARTSPPWCPKRREEAQR